MRIQTKLLIAILSATVLLFILMYVLMQWSFDRGQLDYVNKREIELQQTLISNLQSFYQRYGNWDTLKNKNNWRRLVNISRRGLSLDETTLFMGQSKTQRSKRRNERKENNKGSPPLRHKPHSQLISLVDPTKRFAIVGTLDTEHRFTAVIVNDLTTAWLTMPSKRRLTAQADLAFRSGQKSAYLIITGIMMGISLLIAIPLARHFSRPIKNLANNIEQLASGNYEISIATQGNDEISQLSTNLKRLAKVLGHNESQRQQWIADISHELRTPLSIMKGEVEALMDGIRPFEKKSLVSINEELEQLQKIIDDLYELTKSEMGILKYSKSTFDIVDFMHRSIAKHQSQFDLSEIQLKLKAPDKPIAIAADQTRIHQLVDNVLGNALKYLKTSDILEISVTLDPSTLSVILNFYDSGDGVPQESLDKLFDHMYRVESSRNRKTGGSGLGLAICKKIVEAHNGTLLAKASPLGGLWIQISLPTSAPTE